MPKQRTLELADAMRDRQRVRFRRRFESSYVYGWVLHVGPRFFLLAYVGDGVRLDGFACFRASDVKDFGPAPYAAFVEAALKKRVERRPKKPRVSLANIGELLLSAGRAFPLVAIHREQLDPDVCFVGRVLDVSGGRLSMLEIGPDAVWEDTPEEYRLSEITRGDFGGDYENALDLVGGAPPPRKAGDRSKRMTARRDLNRRPPA
jgi:hypothetical protein